MDYINSDDDDLFDYDPEEEVNENDIVENLSDSNQTKSQLSDDYVSTVKETLKNTEIDTDDGGVNRACIKLAEAFHNGTHHWIHQDENAAPYFRTLSYTLNKLTNNDFSKIELFYHTEHILGRKILVDFLMREVFAVESEKDDEKEGIQQMMKEMFDVDVSDFFMQIIYENLYILNKHSIMLDRILYTELAHSLDIPVIDGLFEDDPHLPQLHRALNYNTEFAHKRQKIINDLLTEEVMKGYGGKLVVHEENQAEAEADS